MVANQPNFQQLWPTVCPLFEDIDFIAAHNSGFDGRVLNACLERAYFEPLTTPYLCTVQLARKVWNAKPANLPSVCALLEIPLQHHDALSDARASALITIRAMVEGRFDPMLIKPVSKPKPKKAIISLSAAEAPST
jgi:DNA polymerase-3 subunit epsilon